ncbi:hypothetical protein EV702DRAFT_1043895 [Suillus placidus]|uniref:Uncharacterized protein n=1 Tax=Suillus placidus TaxID=48579 RepID=A0A9P7D557_9AGAM|nr:hypothetical protein EV702DRAFT_1043895 [Suillus placidus]
MHESMVKMFTMFEDGTHDTALAQATVILQYYFLASFFLLPARLSPWFSYSFASLLLLSSILLTCTGRLRMVLRTVWWTWWASSTQHLNIAVEPSSNANRTSRMRSEVFGPEFDQQLNLNLAFGNFCQRTGPNRTSAALIHWDLAYRNVKLVQAVLLVDEIEKICHPRTVGRQREGTQGAGGQRKWRRDLSSEGFEVAGLDGGDNSVAALVNMVYEGERARTKDDKLLGNYLLRGSSSWSMRLRNTMMYPPPPPVNRVLTHFKQDMRSLRHAVGNKIGRDPELVLAILPTSLTDIYHAIKSFGDVIAGVLLIMVLFFATYQYFHPAFSPFSLA